MKIEVTIIQDQARAWGIDDVMRLDTEDDRSNGYFKVIARADAADQPGWVALTIVRAEALPCPFCSTPARHVQEFKPDSREDTVSCRVPDCPVGERWNDREAWNHRPLKALDQVIQTQGIDGNWDYSQYMYGMYVGLIMAKGIASGVPATLPDPPKAFVSDSEAPRDSVRIVNIIKARVESEAERRGASATRRGSR